MTFVFLQGKWEVSFVLIEWNTLLSPKILSLKNIETFVCGSFCHFLPNDFVVFAVFYKVFSTSNRNVHKLHINFSRRKKAIKFDLPKQTQFDQRHITVSMASFLFAFFSRLRHIIQVQSSEISAKSNSKQPIGKMRFLRNSNSSGVFSVTQKKGMFSVYI